MSVNIFYQKLTFDLLQTAVHRAGRAAGVPSEGVQGEQALVHGERGAAVEAPQWGPQ